ncbi:copper amine oxidase N-terminal domain-containing protein [Paenibacillus sp. NFR01]|uniref:copper amine oxidase N-terminal domain-containing protein n=1 Tax=Paenibacillus sp. NFR01 TaxID=1566279 RepID=UPI0008CCBFD6|nr:copper amine oxidase N-terminal domain-containing protein [Paenibacillus sp. NFR01]SEU15250.1 Copper amine oxidase N-terminal domain-containing protein [Paenibacillus sp. NFR01]
MDKRGNKRKSDKGGSLAGRGVCILLTCALLLPGLPVSRAAAASAGSQTLRLVLKVGSTAATVNGKAASIPRPFLEKGAVMVPLGVFKKTFGSTVTLEAGNVVKVMYGPHTGALTIGSTAAWRDGEKYTLAAPPHMVSGVLMVPLRFVAEVLGADIAKDAGGGLTVTLQAESVEDEDSATANAGIDSEVGKTRIGNSYYGWSMNYPSGLVVGDSGGNEAIATFTNTEDKYYLEVHVSPLTASAEPEDLLEQLVRESDEGGETVLDRELVRQGPYPYARIVSKDSGGAIWESRKYAYGNRLYEVYLTDDNAVNYKDLRDYSTLLDSFRPSFDAAGGASRDLSSVTGGLKSAFNEDYGISLGVPAEWSMDNQRMEYSGGDGAYLRVKVTSVPAGKTLADWSSELSKQIGNSYVEGAYEFKADLPVTISGTQGLMKETQLNPGSGWTPFYQILLQEGGYRYYFEYLPSSDASNPPVSIEDMVGAMDIDFTQVKANFGQLESGDLSVLASKTITKRSKTYGYSLAVPRLWIPDQDLFELGAVQYHFTGGSFKLEVRTEESAKYRAEQLKRYYTDNAGNTEDPVLENVEQISLAGVPATVLTVHQQKDGIPFRIKQIVFEKNSYVYTITTTLNDANATSAQQAMLEQAVQSFTFTDARK